MIGRIVRLVQMVAASGAGLAIADACAQPVSGQCPPGVQIFIDPRLVPMRPQVSREQFQAVMASPSMADWEKQRIYNDYMNQYQPIQLPFRGGIVLINPTNPCIQQYLGN
jgi:hypothetical protein